MPAVVVTTERFDVLARTVMKAQRVPPSIAVEIKGNPEFVSDEALALIADKVTRDVIVRLTQEHAARKGAAPAPG